jgi:large subunit ribosomal protein L22
MEVKAVTKYVRISPFKLRAPVEALKGKPVEEALNLLKFMPLKAAGIISKTLSSAVANAEHNNDLDVDELFVKNIVVDQGPTLKRFRARARGRGARILKRTSHITVTVAETV